VPHGESADGIVLFDEDRITDTQFMGEAHLTRVVRLDFMLGEQLATTDVIGLALVLGEL
jgi:hypothetical protein